MNEPIEKTSDWILSKYVQDDVCKHENKHYDGIGGIMCRDCLRILELNCKHGIYKLVAPRKIICTNCQTVIIDTQEMDGIADWMHDLCRGA